GKTATDAHTLSLTESPVHNHGGATGGQSQDHTHQSTYPTSTNAGQNGAAVGVFSGGDTTKTTGGASQDHTHGIGSAGGGDSHTHPMDIRVQYVDCIIATAD